MSAYTGILAHALAWDPVLILVDALRHVGPNASAQQVRDYILSSRNWPGHVSRPGGGRL